MLTQLKKMQSQLVIINQTRRNGKNFLFPESPPEFSPGLDTELKKLAHQVQITEKEEIVTNNR